jgi:D-glycero-D-manno-heptose 1,7-bisphosphate phosphatase
MAMETEKAKRSFISFMNKAVFLDKDGTLIHDIPYNTDPSLIRLQAGAGRSLRLLKEEGYLLVLVSNQAGVAHGYFKEDALAGVEEKLQQELRKEGVQLDALYFCPHHPDGIIKEYALTCTCRKPKPGMLLQAAQRLDIDLSQSWMIGDILHDVEAGNKAGCNTILINNGNETEWKLDSTRYPTEIASSIPEAASIILQSHGQS